MRPISLVTVRALSERLSQVEVTVGSEEFLFSLEGPRSELRHVWPGWVRADLKESGFDVELSPEEEVAVAGAVNEGIDQLKKLTP